MTICCASFQWPAKLFLMTPAFSVRDLVLQKSGKGRGDVRKKWKYTDIPGRNLLPINHGTVVIYFFFCSRFFFESLGMLLAAEIYLSVVRHDVFFSFTR